MIKVWSTGKLATENPIFFRSKSSEKPYLIYKNVKTEVGVAPVEGEWQGEFRVSLPGTYTLQIGKETYPFEVVEYQRLSFHYELVFTALAVALFFLVLILKKRRPREV